MNTTKNISTADDTHCMNALMTGSPSEIYLIDAATLDFVDVNISACNNLQYPRERLLSMTLTQIAPALSRERLDAVLAPDNASIPAEMIAEYQRSDGSHYSVTLRLLRSSRNARALIVGISACQTDSAALQLCQSRLDALTAHVPGLVYQFMLHDDQSVSFPYLSLGCKPLLGLSPEQLQQNPALFLELLLPADRPAYLESMQASASTLCDWNWEGRIWVADWHDVKWINLRSTAHALPDNTVQWEGIISNVTSSRLEQLELRLSRARLAELKSHLEKIKEREHTRIAREIHDDLGSNLTAIKMAMAALIAGLPPENTSLQQRAAYVDTLVDRSIDAAHRIALDLRPAMLDLGIVAALEWQISEFEKQTGVRCAWKSPQADITLNLDHATALFRIFQEALNNIAKHARASRVSVRLLHTRREVILKITDNGCGIAPEDRAKPESFGIRSMMERAEALGGSVMLTDAAGGGTTITIKIALSAVAAPHWEWDQQSAADIYHH
jgi:two-component system sensor histidine kinase UhpB